MFPGYALFSAALISQALAWPSGSIGHGIEAFDMQRRLARRTTKPADNPFDIRKLQFMPATPNDRRSPCPALNVAANMGVLPRSGKNISSEVLSKAIQDLYNLDQTFADVIAATGVAFVTPPLATQQTISLEDLHRHGAVEHDASISRLDAIQGDQVSVNRELFQKFLDDGEGDFITLQSVAKTRTRRVKESQDAGSPALGLRDRTNTYGEASLILLLFGSQSQRPSNKTGYYAPKKMLEQWFVEERIPDGWQRPKEALTTTHVVYTAIKIMTAQQIGWLADYLPEGSSS